MARATSPAVDALPESSDDELENHDPTKDETHQLQIEPLLQDDKPPNHLKRNTQPMRSSGRNKKLKLIEEEHVLKDIDYKPQANPEEPILSGASSMIWDDMASSMGTQTKRAKTYSRQKKVSQSSASQLAPPTTEPTKQGIHIPPSPRKRSKSKGLQDFITPEEPSLGARSKRKLRTFEPVPVASPPAKIPRVADKGLEIPDAPASSNSLSGTEASNVFSHISNDPYDSDSGLSSADSNISNILDAQQKDDLFDDQAVGMQCPVCRKYLGGDQLPPNSQVRSWSLSQKQDFCYQHKQRDGRKRWTDHNYPEINWVKLEVRRIPKQLPHLLSVLQEATPSYYLSQLQQSIVNANGRRKAIEQYLRQGVLEVQGYYGPRGAKMMVSGIVEHLSQDLQRQLKVNKTIRTTGVGSYISAVLLPELIMKLVMEDMHITDQEEARSIMAKSTDLGVLLNPDDDHIDVADADIGD